MRHPCREEEPALHRRRMGPRKPDTPSRGMDQGVLYNRRKRGGSALFVRFAYMFLFTRNNSQGVMRMRYAMCDMRLWFLWSSQWHAGRENAIDDVPGRVGATRDSRRPDVNLHDPRLGVSRIPRNDTPLNRSLCVRMFFTRRY